MHDQAAYPVWSKTMPPTTQSPWSRPPGAPVYYLGRPASWWMTALRQQPHGHLPQASPAGPR